MRTNRGRYQIRYKRRRRFSLGSFFSSIVGFIGERKFLFAGIAAAAVVVVLFVTGVINPTAATMAQGSAAASASPSSSALASASDAATPSKSTGPIIGTTIGVSVLSPTLEDYQLMAYFDKEANADIKSKELTNFIMANAKGDGKKQYADIQDMITKGANTIVVIGTKSEDFAKISELCAQSKVQIVACNVDATQGFAVDVMSEVNHALKFAQFAQKSGATTIYTVGANTTEVKTIDTVVHVDANIASTGASKNISDRLNINTPVWDLMFFDNSANAVLKMYIKKGVLPNSISTPAYVGFIKTWYALMHDGVDSTTAAPVGNKTTASPSPSASAKASASASPSASASVSPSASASASPSASASASSSATASASSSATASASPSASIAPVAKADPAKFHVIAYTKVLNLGEIVYRFALNLSAGRTLPQPNYVFDTSGEEYITNENIDSYYAKIGKLTDQDILPSIGDSGTVDALFQ